MRRFKFRQTLVMLFATFAFGPLGLAAMFLMKKGPLSQKQLEKMLHKRQDRIEKLKKYLSTTKNPILSYFINKHLNRIQGKFDVLEQEYRQRTGRNFPRPPGTLTIEMTPVSADRSFRRPRAESLGDRFYYNVFPERRSGSPGADDESRESRRQKAREIYDDMCERTSQGRSMSTGDTLKM